MSNFNRWWSANNKYNTNLYSFKIKAYEYNINDKGMKALCNYIWNEAAKPYLESIKILEKKIEELSKQNKNYRLGLAVIAD